MNNSIEAGGNELIFVDYSDLLEKILQVLRQQQKLFRISEDQKRLLIDVDTVASQVAILQLCNPTGASAHSVKAATVNFSPGFKENFPSQIRAIADCLKQLLESATEQHQDLIENLITDLQTFKASTSNLDFTYPFTSYQGLQKQRLTFFDKTGQGKELLRFHKVTITVQRTRNFNEHLREGLENYIKVKLKNASVEELEELDYILEDLHKDKENRESDFYRLRRIVDKETLGKLKKQAQVNYLEFLYEQINTDSSSANVAEAIYLQDLIRRLKLVEEYINDVSKADGYYQVNYTGISLNYRDFFSRGEAFDMLPIIPKIEGYLGETKDEQRGEIQFIFGFKLKFDGKAQAHGGKTSFQYYINLLNPGSQEHKTALQDAHTRETFARKVLKIVFLYYFLFASRSNPLAEDYQPATELSYNPVANFEQKVLPTLKGDDEEAKQKLFTQICKSFQDINVQHKVNELKKLLIKVINYKRTFPTKEYPLHIYVKQSILEQEIDNIIKRNTFFQTVLRGNSKEVLKYITVGEANAQENSLCTLPTKITISDIHYTATDDKQSFNMEYADIEGIRTLPLLFLPSLQDKRCLDVYEKNFKHRQLVLFPYRLENIKLEAAQAFNYRFTFCLLTYICIKMLLAEQKRLFMPILRLHLHNKEDDAPIEKFIVSLSGVLSHLLNEEHRSNTQGVDIRELHKFKVANVMSSLYSVLPKKFTFTTASDSPQLVDKLAIIIVSSRESDRKFDSSQKLANLMGEILGLRCQNGAVRVQLLKTFSDNYEQQQMYRHPSVIIDEVAQLYQKGYRHFVYISKAPYTSTLHMTQTEEEDGLFFMSKEVISALKANRDDIKIYPMFFDKYYAVNFVKNMGTSSLYIQDTMELTFLVEDPSQKSVVFFNLFNGIVVGKSHERNYNGVISYSTFLNIYKDVLDDEDIRLGLIYKGKLKDEILQCLTLFHFSRYEKARDINLKLDPYENIIGDQSVGALSLFSHMRGKGEFNSLAFLTEVKKILNVQKQ